MSKKEYVIELSEELNQIYSHLGVEAFPNQQEEALKIIDRFEEKDKKITDLETKLAEYKSKTRVAFGQLASFQLQYDDLKKEYKGQEGLLEKTLATNTKLQLELDQIKQQLVESEKQVKHWHDLYNNRDKQFQSVRQRYHLLNKLQSNYDKKDKLHLAYMQCAELIEENEKLKKQLEEKQIQELENVRKYVDGRTYLAQYLDERVKQLKENRNV